MKKLWRYDKPFRYNTGTWRTDGRTDGQTEFLSISRVSITVLKRDITCKPKLQRPLATARTLLACTCMALYAANWQIYGTHISPNLSVLFCANYRGLSTWAFLRILWTILWEEVEAGENSHFYQNLRVFRSSWEVIRRVFSALITVPYEMLYQVFMSHVNSCLTDGARSGGAWLLSVVAPSVGLYQQLLVRCRLFNEHRPTVGGSGGAALA